MSTPKASSSKEKSTPKKFQQTNRLGSYVMTALIGFLGGLLAVRISPGTITSTDNVTQVVRLEGELIADTVERVADSVVSIDVTSVSSNFNPFFGSDSRERQGAGTGIILTGEGLIVTNKHVIDESTTEVSVVLNDGTIYNDVEVIGREPFNDIAYLKIKDVSGLTPANLGDSDTVRVGEQVIAIGNALGEFDTTVTSGIISGNGRPITAGTGQDSEQLVNLFQTDASINPGNSGGPLLNISGEIIGINTAVAGNAENIGFAIPINDVKPGIKSIADTGKLLRPYLGVRYVNLNKQIADELEAEAEVGALIFDEGDEAILPGSPAERAGLKNGDIIRFVDDIEINDDNQLPNVVSRYQVGEFIELEILRDGEIMTLSVKLQQVPEGL